ncbi:MAG: Wzt carbohydrate-binding domain-containing protein, partial [Candidatus Hodarchaeota archaeon]
EFLAKKSIRNPIFQISIVNRDGVCVSVLGTHIDRFNINSIDEKGSIVCWVRDFPLLWNSYYVTVTIYDETHNIIFDYLNTSFENHYFTVLPDRTSEKLAEYTPICQLDSKWVVNN